MEELERAYGGMKEKIEEMDKWIAENEATKEVDIDEAIVPRTKIAEQLLKLTAEDSATEDILYELDRAQRKGKLEFPEYLKEVRNFSREQFLKRALFAKIKTTQFPSSPPPAGSS
eukprot:TRINITY_DN1591_c0_g1_i1.p1 TRINITY_DN1591_c0_g1~~TRINITY_DN1591_c0_g1_i1.p1  ORF type:complete len:115 (-),score=2.78 TRINITY_DN1591_c0_g1_i1:95-439(-)